MNEPSDPAAVAPPPPAEPEQARALPSGPALDGGPDRRRRLIARASTVSVLAAVALAALKLLAVIATGSTALMSSAVDSFADLAASGMIWLTFRAARAPAEPRRHMGPGRTEAVSALTQAAFVAGAGLFALSISIRQFVYPAPIQHGWWGLAVMLVSIVVTLVLVGYQRRVVRLTASSAIAADRAHYEGDLLTQIAVVLSLLGAGLYGLERLDPLVGAGVALYLLVMAVRIGRDAVATLLERALPRDLRRQVETLAAAQPGVLAVNQLHGYETGDRCCIDLEVEVAADMPVASARRVADAIEAELEERLAGAEVTVHPVPAGEPPID
ncbi:cation diffusion facilitator family transporter [Geminicoccus flavidas]|uniref:cation diffusion facilitator family transporter n=1 Tax=Geminicoccus flavidas TaxID=2506407 RepID=UPI001F3B6210|nr:cation diffusion facilitator family transporter [Geminicoccus flavidas]